MANFSVERCPKISENAPVLLTITTTHKPATDIGFLLHKNPAKMHSLKLSFGQAYVFYPEASEDCCTVALLLDIDPIGLIRDKKTSMGGFSLESYVNDRPYAASSFMSVAIKKLFDTALAGRCKDRPELVDLAIPLEIRIPVLPCRGKNGEAMLRSLFEPLGYEVDTKAEVLDGKFPEWGESPYFAVTLKSKRPLKEALAHLFVLIPVLDDDKHYWIGDEEVDKLLRFGEGWLAQHPQKELISKRYLKHFRTYVDEALERLSDTGATSEVEPEQRALPVEETIEAKINLHAERLYWAVQKLKDIGAKSVIDLGCGEGRLLGKLLKETQIEKIVGCDVSTRVLQKAKDRLGLDMLLDLQRKRIALFQAALTYRDKRLAGYGAATLLEVIEHLDAPRLEALKRVVFEFAMPRTVIVTTPNIEYNALFENLPPGQLRHKDHRFEWTRQEFEVWAAQVAKDFDYSVTFEGIGNIHERYGAPTQAAIFTKNV